MEMNIYSANTMLLLLLSIPGIIVATTVHEFVRALFSTIFGDNYPKSQKRLTLNPIKHFEVLQRRLWLGQACGNQCPVL